MIVTPYKFVKHEIPPLENLRETCAYRLFENRHNLSRDEKDRLFSDLQTNSRSRKGVPLRGWMFPFHDVLRTFLVKLQHYGWCEVYAPDKTSIRSYYGHRVLRIVLLDKEAA